MAIEEVAREESQRLWEIKARAPDGQIKYYVWWRNFKVGNLSDEGVRHYVAVFIASQKLERGADLTVGLPIDEINSDLEHVAVVKEAGLCGFYVEADKRELFNFMSMMHVTAKEAQLRSQREREFDEVFQRVKASLPFSIDYREAT